MAFDRETYREQSRQIWGDIAPGWEERRAWFMEITGSVNQWLLDKGDPQPGQTVLEVAAGTGDLGLAAASRVGADGRVISTDFAPEMVAIARRIGESDGAANVEYRTMDAESMDLGDNSVDVALCRWGYMLMADAGAAFRETRRVLRDGGRLAFAVWTGADRNPWIALPAITLIQRGHMPPPEPGGPGILALADADRVRSLLTKAGFTDIEFEELVFDFRYPDFDDVWDTLTRLAGPLAVVINALPEDERQNTREAIQDALSAHRGLDGSYIAPASTWAVLAR